MNPNRFSTALGDLIQNSLADVHTTLPAKIISVDYGSGRASVLPLVKTKIGIDKSIPYPELGNVPLVIMSGNSGKARITFPVQAGDTVLVVFSERDPTNVLSSTGTDATDPVQSNYLGLFPIGIIPCISVSGNAKAISNEDVDLENEKSKFNLKPTGEITISNDTGSIKMAAGGPLTINDGTVTFSLSNGQVSIQGATGFNYQGGAFNVNGLTISPSGKLTDSGGLSFDTHKHDGIQRGEATSNGPVP